METNHMKVLARREAALQHHSIDVFKIVIETALIITLLILISGVI